MNFTLTILEDMKDSLQQLFSSPTAVIVLLVLLAGIVFILRFSKIKFTTRLMTHVAIAVAISVVLDMIKLFSMPYGGSVTLASMLPIFLISFAYGPSVGYLTGFIYGIVDLILGAYIIHPIQLLLDYPMPYLLIGVSGYFKNNYLLGVILGTGMRFLSHFLSGVVFFPEYTPEGMNPIWYSVVYNAQYMIPEMIIIIVVIMVFPVKRIIKQMAPHHIQ